MGSSNETVTGAKTVKEALGLLQSNITALRSGFSKTLVLSPPTVASIPAWQATKACRVIGVRGYRQGGTGAAINARINGSAVGIDLSLTTADTWLSSVVDVSLPQGGTLFMDVVSLAGSPSLIVIQVDLEVV